MKKGSGKIFLTITIICFFAAAIIMFAAVLKDFLSVSVPAITEELSAPSPTVPPTASPTPAPTPTPTPTPTPIPEDVKAMMQFVPTVAEEMKTRSGMFARFVMPDSGINVALFTEGAGSTIAEQRQNICDAEDSAALYYDEEGAVIADHNTQGFANLINVQPGHKAYFITADSVIVLECTKLIEGHNNNHKGIVDENYQPIRNAGDFICYTCKDNWLDVRIVVLDIVKEYGAKKITGN